MKLAAEIELLKNQVKMLRKDLKQATAEGGRMFNHIAFNTGEMMSKMREEDKQKIPSAMNAEVAKKRVII